MYQLKILRLVFDAEIAAHEIPAFRGAIAAKVPRDSVLFHQHTGDGLRYAYPLIQYKRVYKRPTIVCVGEGVDQIHQFFQNSVWDITLSERVVPMRIHKLDLSQFNMQVNEQRYVYTLHNWIALDQSSYQAYKQLSTDAERREMLTKKLIGNILSMAKGIGWTIDKTIQCTLTEVTPRKAKVKGVMLLSFDIQFETNIQLPDLIGLGKNVSVGYGVLSRVKNEKI